VGETNTKARMCEREWSTYRAIGPIAVSLTTGRSLVCQVRKPKFSAFIPSSPTRSTCCLGTHSRGLENCKFSGLGPRSLTGPSAMLLQPKDWYVREGIDVSRRGTKMAEPRRKSQGGKRVCLSVLCGGLPSEGARRHTLHESLALLKTTGSRRRRGGSSSAGPKLDGPGRHRIR